MSYSLEACVPAPVCQDSTTKFNSLDSIVDIGDYLGDPKDGTWVGQGEPKQMGDNVLLTMPKDSSGSLLSSSTYMWYGNVKATLKTSRGAGVVTAFILFSDIKDEIDYEFVGVDLKTAQTNFYFQGIPDYENSGNVSVTDTYSEFHDYEIQWTPDKIDWLIDGKIGRTQKRSDTWNETSQQWEFPQTPARVQLSLWPGGLATNAKGTIDWAGGEIDWSSDEVKKAGYYFATVKEVTIECYNAKSAPGTNNGKSYSYTSLKGTNDTVEDGDKDTVLASLLGSGLDMEAGKDDATKTDGGSKPTNTAASIPGEGGSAGQDHSGESTSTSGGQGGGAAGSSPDSAGGDPSKCDISKFNSDCGEGDSGSSSGKGGGKSSGSQTSASALAMVIAGAALYWL